jgi:hypothetical protein
MTCAITAKLALPISGAGDSRLLALMARPATLSSVHGLLEYLTH